MYLRLIYNLAIALAIFTLPWYLYAGLLVAGFLVFNRFAEGIVWAVLIDLWYGPGWGQTLYQFVLFHAFSLTAIALFIAMPLVKPYLLVYNR